MSLREQKKLMETVKRYQNKMDGKEREFFKSLVKRQKDDEDFDSLSMDKLRTLHEKYHVNREKKNFDHFFKKPE